MDLANVKLRIDKLIMRAKDNEKETEGLRIRAGLILSELKEARQLLDESVVTSNAECFNGTTIVTIPTPTAKAPEV